MNAFRHLAVKSEDFLYEVAILGFMKRGKSTLLNTLLGRNDDTLSPVKLNPCTAAIVKYVDKTLHPECQETAIIRYVDGKEYDVSYSELREHIDNKYNKNNEKGISSIKVYGDFPLVRSSVTIVDTPGRGSVYNEHDILVEEFLPSADAIVLTQSSDLPADAEELRYLQSLPQEYKKRIIVVMTKIDTCDEKEKIVSRDYIRDKLTEIGINCSKIYCVAAKPVFDARKDGQHQAVIESLSKEWGISDLERALEAEITNNSDETNKIKNFLTRCCTYIGDFLQEQILQNKNTLEKFTETAEMLQLELQTCNNAKFAFQESYAKNRTKIERAWQLEVRKFMRELEALKEKLEFELKAEAQSSSFFELKKKSRHLEKKINERIHAVIGPQCSKVEIAFQELLEKFVHDINADVEVYCTQRAKVDPKLRNALSRVSLTNATKYPALMGVGVATVLPSAWFAGNAWTAWATSKGGLAFFSKWFGTVTATKTAAMGAAAIATTATSILAVSFAGVIVYFSGKAIFERMYHNLENNVEDCISQSVRDFFKSASAEVQLKCEEIFCSVIEDFTNSYHEQVEEYDRTLSSIQQSLTNNDKSLYEKQKRDTDTLQLYHNKSVDIMNKIRMFFNE